MFNLLLILSLIGAEFTESIHLEEGDARGVVDIDLSGCRFYIKKGEPGSIASVKIWYDENRLLPNIDCERIGDVCRVNISTEEKENTMFAEDSALITLSPVIPLSLRIYTSTNSIIDLSEIMVEDLDVVLGTGNTALLLSGPNPVSCERVRIYGNLARLTTEGLGNLNFSNFYMDLNAGMANLDMRGEYRGRSNVEIKSGIAVINVTLPQNTGVRLKTNGIIYTTAEGLAKDENWYTSSDFSETTGELVIHVQGGLGSLNVSYEND